MLGEMCGCAGCMHVSSFYVPVTSIFRLKTIKYNVILHVALTNNKYFALLFGHIKIEIAHILHFNDLWHLGASILLFLCGITHFIRGYIIPKRLYTMLFLALSSPSPLIMSLSFSCGRGHFLLSLFLHTSISFPFSLSILSFLHSSRRFVSFSMATNIAVSFTQKKLSPDDFFLRPALH